MKVINVDDVPRVCLFAVSQIEKGSEVRYNYGKDMKFPWREQVSY